MPPDASVAAFPAAFLGAVRRHALVDAARRSPHADELLHNDDVRAHAVTSLRRALRWVPWIAARRPESAPAAIAMLLLAQGFFVAACDDVTDAFPSAALVRRALDECDAREWFAESGVVLPAVLARDSSP